MEFYGAGIGSILTLAQNRKRPDKMMQTASKIAGRDSSRPADPLCNSSKAEKCQNQNYRAPTQRLTPHSLMCCYYPVRAQRWQVWLAGQVGWLFWLSQMFGGGLWCCLLRLTPPQFVLSAAVGAKHNLFRRQTQISCCQMLCTSNYTVYTVFVIK